MCLVGVIGREGEEEVDDVAGVGAAIAVVAEEDDDGRGEIGCLGFEVGPEGSELGNEAVDVAYTDYCFLFLVSVFHFSYFVLGNM